MDNTENLGAAMAAAAAKDQAKSQEQRIQALERKVTLLSDVAWKQQQIIKKLDDQAKATAEYIHNLQNCINLLRKEK